MADTATAIVLREYGEADVLRAERVDVPPPGPGEALVRQTAIGINFHDVYVRSGLYRTLALPGIPGIEAAGVVESVGPGVAAPAAGDRVVYLTNAYGAYADWRVIAADRLVRLPPGLEERTAASVFLKGLTVHMLIDRVHRVQAGDTVLVHAAAGGVGRILCQWASALGAIVIGTVGSDSKAAIGRGDGCAHTIVYTRDDVVARVRQLAPRGVDVVYDAVGRDTFAASLETLGLRGHLVNYGQASGPVEPLSVASLGAKSTTLSRPIVFHYVAERSALESMAAALFEAIRTHAIRPHIAAEYALSDAAAAHRALEQRATTGSAVLVPD
ncbi:MAG: quinone oxidoreductase [Candidatus Velthaea sp.]